MTIEQIQARVQELYDIIITEFTREQSDELLDLLKKAESMGYERAMDDNIDAIRFVKRRKRGKK